MVNSYPVVAIRLLYILFQMIINGIHYLLMAEVLLCSTSNVNDYTEYNTVMIRGNKISVKKRYLLKNKFIVCSWIGENRA